MPKQLYKQKNNKISGQNRINLIQAIYLAYCLRLTLNRFVTINLEAVCSHNPRQVLNLFLDNYSKFCTRRNFTSAYIWVLENNHGDNLHAHILLHIPSNQHVRWINEFKRKVKHSWFEHTNLNVNKEPNWFNCKSLNYGMFYNQSLLREVLWNLNARIAESNSDCKDNADTVNSDFRAVHFRDYQFYHVVNLVAYLLKGTVANSQGRIMGRRTGRSNNLIHIEPIEEEQISSPSDVSNKIDGRVNGFEDRENVNLR